MVIGDSDAAIVDPRIMRPLRFQKSKGYELEEAEAHSRQMKQQWRQVYPWADRKTLPH